jgi:hypothetical protein
MLDIFDQPWTLIGAAVLVFFGVLTYRSIFPEKKSRLQWLLPLFVIAAAFGTDYLVQTDLEKIDAVLNTGIKAVTEKDFQTIEAIISENYSDSYHNSKQSLIADCRQQLSQNLVEKIKKTGQLTNISVPNAKATVFIIMTFDKDSYVSQNFVSFLQMKVDIYLQKQPHNEWLINRVEIREINRQSTGWNQIR